MMPHDTFLLLVYVFMILAPFAIVSLTLLDDPNIDERKVLRGICMTVVIITLALSTRFSMGMVF